MARSQRSRLGGQSGGWIGYRRRLARHLPFGNSRRNSVTGPYYTNSDVYITKSISIEEGVAFRFDKQMFNACNHPISPLPSEVEAGVARRVGSR